MSLLGKKNLGLILISALFLLNCEDPNEIGLELKADSDKVGAFYREINLQTSVINNDSLLTSSSVRLLSGHYADPDFGITDASAYTQFGFGTSKLNIPETAQYDSLILACKLEYTFGPDIIKLQTFNIHELTEDLYDSAAYFSFSTAEYAPEIISTGKFLLPEIDDTVLIFKMNSSFGERLFQAAADTNIIDPGNVKTLIALFKGFSIVADPNNNSLLGINVNSDNTYLKLYYHSPGDTVSSSYQFSLYGWANFNRIVTDWNGTPLAGIENQHYIDFYPSNGKAYLQSGNGLILKLDMQPVIDFFDTISFSTINKSDIELKIDLPAFNQPSPSSLQFYFASYENKRIRSGNSYLGIISEGASELLNATYDPAIPGYKATISIYTDNIRKLLNPYSKILLYPPEFGLSQTLNQLKISTDNVKIKLYYTRLK